MASSPPLRGKVVEFDGPIGLGQVQGQDGRTLPFHCTRISDGSRSVEVGADVMFEIGPGMPGVWEAITVVKLAG